MTDLRPAAPEPRLIRLFPTPQEAVFLNRPNRFVVSCEREERVFSAHLPNPGRLQELLIPGCRLFLVPSAGAVTKLAYTVVGVEREGRVIMLHTLRTNAAARALIEAGRIPGLEGAKIRQAEVRQGHSRFDFLLEWQGRPFYLEVKSCTLVGERVAMFPDAVTARGTRHLLELADLGKEGLGVGVLFLVHWFQAQHFMPDFHTDLVFAQTFLDLRRQVRFFPVAVHWEKDLTLRLETKPLSIPWGYLEQEVQDRGSYLLILHLKEDRRISFNENRPIFFPAGYYVYVGSAPANLSRQIERHRRLRKNFHGPIDHLRAISRFHAVLPIRASVRLECVLAKALAPMSQGVVPQFGNRDCSCAGHLFRFEVDPLQMPTFQKLLLYFRMDRFFMPGERDVDQPPQGREKKKT